MVCSSGGMCWSGSRGVEGLVQGELPEEAIAGLAMVEGVAGVVVGSSLTAHCRCSVGGSRFDGRRWTFRMARFCLTRLSSLPR